MVSCHAFCLYERSRSRSTLDRQKKKAWRYVFAAFPATILLLILVRQLIRRLLSGWRVLFISQKKCRNFRIYETHGSLHCRLRSCLHIEATVILGGALRWLRVENGRANANGVASFCNSSRLSLPSIWKLAEKKVKLLIYWSALRNTIFFECIKFPVSSVPI